MQKSKSSWKITCWFVILYVYVNVITITISREEIKKLWFYSCIIWVYHETELKKYVEIKPYYAAKTVFRAANFSIK